MRIKILVVVLLQALISFGCKEESHKTASEGISTATNQSPKVYSFAILGKEITDKKIEINEAATVAKKLLEEERNEEMLKDEVQNFASGLGKFLRNNPRLYLELLIKTMGVNLEISEDLELTIDMLFFEVLARSSDGTMQLSALEEYYLVQFVLQWKIWFESNHSRPFRSENLINYFKEKITSLKSKGQLIVKDYGVVGEIVGDNADLFSIFMPVFNTIEIDDETNYLFRKSYQRMLKYLKTSDTDVNFKLFNNKENVIQTLKNIETQSNWALTKVTSDESHIHFDEMLEYLDTNLFYQDKLLAIYAQRADGEEVDAEFYEFHDSIVWNQYSKYSKRFLENSKILKAKLVNHRFEAAHPFLLSTILTLNLSDTIGVQDGAISRLLQLASEGELTEIGRENIFPYLNKIISVEGRLRAYFLNFHTTLIGKAVLKHILRKENVSEVVLNRVKEITISNLKMANILRRNLTFQLDNPDLIETSIGTIAQDTERINLPAGVYNTDLDYPNVTIIFHPLALVQNLGGEIKINLKSLEEALIDASGEKQQGVVGNTPSRGSSPSQSYRIVQTEYYKCEGGGPFKHCSGENRFEHYFSVNSGTAPEKSRTGSIGNSAGSIKIELKEVKGYSAPILLAIGGQGGMGETGISSPLCSEGQYIPWYGREGVVGTSGNHTATQGHGENGVSPKSYSVSGGVSGDGGEGGAGGLIEMKILQLGGNLKEIFSSTAGGAGGNAGMLAYCLGPVDANQIQQFRGKTGNSGTAGTILK